MLVNGNGLPVPIAGLTQFTPAIPKLYWDVDSQEQGIRQLWKVVEKLCRYANEICDQTNLNTKDIAELQKRFEEFVEHGFDDYYAEQLEQWFIDNAWKIYERIAKQVFFGLTDDGYFCAYVPESWKEIEFDTGAIYGTEEYGRLILRFAADGHGVINNTGYDASVMTDTIDSRLMSAAGTGLNYANDQLNVNVANRQTFGGVKLETRCGQRCYGRVGRYVRRRVLVCSQQGRDYRAAYRGRVHRYPAGRDADAPQHHAYRRSGGNEHPHPDERRDERVRCHANCAHPVVG